MERIFLLSPADCGGARARLVRNAEARFELARRLQSSDGAPLGDVFSFMSGLYFRGKLTYARAFGSGARAVMVITPSDGLRPPERRITLADLERYAGVPVAPDELRYRRPLQRSIRSLNARLPAESEVVLLGSLATNKYLQILAPALGERLRFPRDFIGLGDMSRGALLLRCVREDRELEYVGLGAMGVRA
jgi:hypothetical protein